ncbi:nucleoside monophosphate kinase [Iamia sp. SCSIO 61187]|uniref:nucleoside monophosphate kinase n=1 Tax=Iamia sp. SCSIO 61187 TaxID=2722752 RepID=UPI001C62FC6B|nr:nucleoside monophosphate kinase [Iamia sp. SCSIO 61187]QYG94268.1 nucleoside monophosphate kinase [Iamia sp. SCSIO 61187]
MRVILLGPPGSGKGTQARLLASHLGVTHLSVGAVLRAEIRGQSRLGARIAAAVAAVDLVPMADVLDVLDVPLTMATRSGGGVLDGAPRAVDQAAALDGTLDAMDAPADRVVVLEVPENPGPGTPRAPGSSGAPGLTTVRRSSSTAAPSGPGKGCRWQPGTSGRNV